ncbi:sensor histidine kinase [Taibaiella koreensis]|uniref:sensor histidine kinase n=1 Tax=Taibaiella koreensis TaxID=1268548 RepID=UPI000E59B42C|nr:histidine kinase [Taibaiella koreensis]
MRISFKLCFLLLLYGSCLKAHAQLPGMRRYTQFDGYTASTGYLLDQDAEGFLWIGTDNGGMRFDGKKFGVLQELRHSPDVDIISCSPIGKDRILLVPANHATRLLEKGKLITAREDPRLMDTALRELNSFTRDPVTGSRWLSNNSSIEVLHRFCGDSVSVFHLSEPNFSLHYIFNNRIIGLRGKEIVCYTLASRSIQCLYDGATKRKLLHDNQTQLIDADCSATYIFIHRIRSREVVAYRYVEGDSTVNPVRILQLSPGTSPEFRVLTDNQGRLWIKFYGKGGIAYYGDIERGTSRDFFQFMQPMALNTLFIDRNNNLWMTSRNNTLYFLSQKHFQNALLTKAFPRRQETPRAVSGDQQGRLLIGYINSPELDYINAGEKHRIRLIHSFDQGLRKILPTGDGRYLLCAANVALFDPAKVALSYLGIYGHVKDICLYKNKGLLIATSYNLQYCPSLSNGNKARSLLRRRCTAVALLGGDSIMVGTSGGLYIMQGLGGPIGRADHPVLKESSISDLQVMADGSLLVGTNARGLYRYTSGGQVLPVQTAGGQPEQIRDIYRQNDSIYWVASDNGVWRFIFGKKGNLLSSQNYTFYDGLPSNNVNAVFVSRDTAYIATADGMGVVPLRDSLRYTMAAPEIYLNTLQTNKLSFRKPTDRIVLDHLQRDLLFNLSVISYESLGNLRYYYRLYPFQQEWTPATDPDVRFTHLPPGQYRFQAYALNAKGDRSRKTIDIMINIQPAFWQTFYFTAAVFAVIGTILFLVFRYWVLRRERNRLEKVQEKKRLAELELEAIKAQINPHFIYNCLNSIQYLNYKLEHEQAQQYLDLFARLIRMTMQYSRQTFIRLDEEVSYLSLYLQLEQLRFKDKLTYHIAVDPAVDRSVLLPAMLVQPYVENALKHGIAGRDKGSLDIHFCRKANQLQVTIQDNGAGFSGQNRPGAQGLRLSGTRALSYNELFNFNISIHAYNRQDSEPGSTGAVVKVGMKYFQESLRDIS